MPRRFLDPQRIAPAALQKLASFYPDVLTAIEQAVRSEQVVVVGMAQNPHVKKVRALLSQAGVQFTYLEYGSYFSKWRERLAIKLWSGWPTFPQVYVRGVLIGGCDLTEQALADGTLQSRLTAASPADMTPSPAQA
jgi:glutaredoxin-related protein